MPRCGPQSISSDGLPAGAGVSSNGIEVLSLSKKAWMRGRSGRCVLAEGSSRSVVFRSRCCIGEDLVSILDASKFRS